MHDADWRHATQELPGRRDLVIVACAVAAAVMGGALFVFSSFIMRALDRLPTAEAIRSMQRINEEAITWSFMLALFGPGALAIAALIAAGPTAPLVAGALLYLVGVIGVTAAANVPLNDRLAKVDPEADGGFWAVYLARWTAYNHLRTALAVAASVAFLAEIGW